MFRLTKYECMLIVCCEVRKKRMLIIENTFEGF